MSHTILLMQTGAKPESRTYCEYESIRECMRGVCHIYEEHLKKINPNAGTIIYDICELYNFMDSLADIVCLVYQKDGTVYAPRNREWIKEQLYIVLSD